MRHDDEQSPHTAPLETVPDSSSPAYANRHPLARAFDSFASAATRWAGSPIAFTLAVAAIVIWGLCGPLFHYSDAWQLIINTSTTIITFLMVFVIQQSQNKDSVAVHLKLNELIAAYRTANNQLIGIEDASEEDLRRIANAYLELANKAGTTKADRETIEKSVSEAKAAPSGERQCNVDAAPQGDSAPKDRARK
ncbi:low affinity iron permease family protein [Trinickia sp. Y13]|uniref:low affinity iron permease family protein n=1 Tax=Trinickia sp. Y13 TaxID=2917807 RepID=UPI002404E6BC|nr:low affinity iron permease family protein [Trinickia sp. Y13]MDG0026748.1 low affinity iron permease family protein [Trinickia sp. Y13]